MTENNEIFETIDTDGMFCEYIDPDELPEDEEYIDEVKPHFYHRKSFWILSALAVLLAFAGILALLLKRKK